MKKYDILGPDHPSRGVKKCVSYHINDPKALLQTCCTICIFCKQEGADVNQDGVFYHGNCYQCPMDRAQCKRTIQVEKRNNDEIAVKIKCHHRCKVCDQVCTTRQKLIMLNWSDYYHRECMPELHCQICNKKEDHDVLFQSENIVKHMQCELEKCIFCDEYVLDESRKDYPLNLLESTGKKAHYKCASLQGCHICGLSNQLSFNGSKFYHTNCKTEKCKICNIVIGPNDFLRVENDLYHQNCLRQTKCYICNEFLGNGDVKLSKTNKLKHFICREDRCTECSEMFGIKIYKSVNKQMYHVDCGPVCHICNCKDSGELIISTYESGKYHHKNCINALCIICNKSLGKSAPIDFRLKNQNKSFQVHPSCYTRCSSCSELGIFTPNCSIERIDKKYWSYLTENIKTNIIYFIMCAKIRKMPRDLIDMISSEIVNSTENAIESIPFRSNGRINLDEYCTSERCVKFSCKMCGNSPIAWNPKDSTRCRGIFCVKVNKILIRIRKHIFKASVDQNEWTIRYKQGSHVYMRSVCREFLEKAWTLTPEEIQLYHSLMMTVNILVNLT